MERPANVHTPRAARTATVLYSGKVLVTCGGYFWPRYSDASADGGHLRPGDELLVAVRAIMARARHGHFAIRLFSGMVLVVGGIDGGNTVELYDPYNNVVVPGAAPALRLRPRSLSATMLYSGEVLVTDGIG